MENFKKVRLMANLAIYDKHFGEEDRKITSQYRRDYIYKKNLSLRLGIVVGVLLIVALYYSYKLFVANVDVFGLFNRAEFIRLGIMLLAILVIYTIIGTVVNGKRYDEAEERLELYEKMLNKLYDRQPEKETIKSGGGQKLRPVKTPKAIKISDNAASESGEADTKERT